MWRPKVPRKIEAVLMFSNDHTCCICRKEGKDVDIHHIDGDRTNNRVVNLAVLCLNCHSKVTGRRGLGRSYSTLEVKMHKRDWEYRVRRIRGLLPSTKSRHTQSTYQIKNDIRRIIYELASAEDSTLAKNKLELLWIYCVLDLKVNSNYILDLFYDVVPFLAENEAGPLTAEFIPRLFYGLPGPQEVKIDSKDVGNLLNAIDFLAWLGKFSAEFLNKISTPKSCLDSLYELFLTALTYGLKNVIGRVKKGVREIKQAAAQGGMEDKKVIAAMVYAKKIEKKIEKGK